jgi:diguanylate cyclase (GGDEF)-like protein
MNPPPIQALFIKYIERATWVTVALSLILIWMLPVTPEEQQQLLLLIVVLIVYGLLIYRWVIPRYGYQEWVDWVGMVVNIVLIGWVSYLIIPYGLPMDLLFVVVVVVSAIMAGFRMAFIASLLAIGVDNIVSVLHETPQQFFLRDEVVLFTILVLSGYLASLLAGVIHQQARDTEQRNRELSLLFDVSATASSSLRLEELIPMLTEKIAKGLPASFCRICILEPNHQALVTMGVSPLRPLEGWEPRLGDRWPLERLPKHRQVIEQGEIVVVRQGDSENGLSEEEREAFFFNGVKSACLVPLVVEDEPYGVISIGEARKWDREPFHQQKLDLLQTLAPQLAMVVHNSRLHQAAHRQVKRLSVLNDVARAISTTIEMDDLLELIYQQLSRVIATDTYFVALYDQETECLDLRILLDEGERFPPQKVPVGRGLSSLVIREKKPLLVRQLSREIQSLPVEPIVMGQAKFSESWLGVPMMTGERFLGLLVVASYQPHAFDEDDVALLTNVANQAALALDNAWHHQQVEEQARRDSLTGVYNHGYFLQLLSDRFEEMVREEKPISLIMLDIDYFKKYNDTYGHVVGDEVLRITVQAIQAHVKRTDVVGRWGGEEFGIALPGASSEQARQVAERVRRTLAGLPLTDTSGKPIPKPTVSQGIATYPEHVRTMDELIVVADRVLYQAKSSGRDQVMVARTG